MGYGDVWGYFTFDRENAFLNRCHAKDCLTNTVAVIFKQAL